MPNWSFFIDRGGTFTDCFALSPTGEHQVAKVLSTDDAPQRAIRQILALAPDAPIPACDVRLGTTLATNAVLERKGARTALLITRGFADILEIGTQARPDIFSLDVRTRKPLCERVLETTFRASTHGDDLSDGVDEQLPLELRALVQSGFESLAIVVLNGHRTPELELRLEALAREASFMHVAVSHTAANERGLLKRTETTVTEAYLAPVLHRYVERLKRDLPHSRVLVMQSSGNLSEPRALRGPQALLSGPAGGVVACEHLARALNLGSAIGFDMGGTSTDVCRVEPGTLPRVYETHVADIRVVAPLVDVHTVAAGGGSICAYDLGRLQVGPESAGAHPGPACYGSPQAHSLTITDVNLLLGRLQVDTFPIPIEREAAEREATRLHARLVEPLSRDEMLNGLLEIANFSMAEAVREVSLRRGFDPRNDALIAFGGAAGQHACALARELGMKCVVFPAFAGILSACGMACASRVTHHQLDGASLLLRADSVSGIAARFDELLAQAKEGSTTDGTRSLALCYKGREARIVLAWTGDVAALQADFHTSHRRQFGFAHEGEPIEIAALHLEIYLEGPAAVPFDTLDTNVLHTAPQHVAPAIRYVTSHFGTLGKLSDVPVYERRTLTETTRIAGPCLIVDATGCLVLEPGFEAVVTRGHLVCTDQLQPHTRGQAPTVTPKGGTR